MKTLNVFVIHSNHLIYRKNIITSTLKILEEASKRFEYFFNATVITDYDVSAVRAKFESIKDDIKPEKTGDNDFDARNYPFNAEKISNFLKQREALKRIVEMKCSGEHYFMIIEDDAIILPEFVINLDHFLKVPKASEWDLLFLCMSHGGNNVLKSTRDDIKVIPSKECFCVTPAAAKDLLLALATMKQIYRIQLSAWIHQTTTIRSVYASGRVSIEGSKIGLLPSTVNDNNILLYNKEFMTLFFMITGKEPMDLDKATITYKSSEHLKSADISHVYAVILFKLNFIKEAKLHFDQAVEYLALKNGLISKTSEILSNAININSLYQNEEIATYKAVASKYAAVKKLS